MIFAVTGGILLPFLGTIIGSAAVFILKDTKNHQWNAVFMGFASGIMVAASVWSLLIPAIEHCSVWGKSAAVPAVLGIMAGFLVLLLLDRQIGSYQRGNRHFLQDSVAMLMIAVTIHNFPEGMAVGAVAAGSLLELTDVSTAEMIALSIGVAIQNIPEGAIISLPLFAAGMPRRKAFLYGALSGTAEPLGAVVTILMAEFISASIPWLLSFAAGAMLYVVVEELIPDLTKSENQKLGTIFFSFGFSLMMLLDVSLG